MAHIIVDPEIYLLKLVNLYSQILTFLEGKQYPYMLPYAPCMEYLPGSQNQPKVGKYTLWFQTLPDKVLDAQNHTPNTS